MYLPKMVKDSKSSCWIRVLPGKHSQVSSDANLVSMALAKLTLCLLTLCLQEEPPLWDDLNPQDFWNFYAIATSQTILPFDFLCMQERYSSGTVAWFLFFTSFILFFIVDVDFFYNWSFILFKIFIQICNIISCV
jgi:hypothetical protein